MRTDISGGTPERRLRPEFVPTLAEDKVLDVCSSRVEAQRVHVGIWYILRAQRGSHIPTLGAKYIPYNYMDPLGSVSFR